MRVGENQQAHITVKKRIHHVHIYRTEHTRTEYLMTRDKAHIMGKKTAEEEQ